MFIIDAQKLVSLVIICNILAILFVQSSNATESEHGSINTPRFLNITKNVSVNPITKLSNQNHNANQNGGFVNPASATDSEVPDLTRTTHHSKSTLPVTAVTKAPKDNNHIDSNYFNIDSLSEVESQKRANGRFNPTSGAIAAAICLSLAVVGYLGIVLWRNVIHRSYENREILLNEDDIGDINDEDMRHFEAACIEIEA